MMQSCALAAKLRSGGPILPVGTKAKGLGGNQPPRTVIGTPSQAYELSGRPPNHWAGRKTTPSGSSQCPLWVDFVEKLYICRRCEA